MIRIIRRDNLQNALSIYFDQAKEMGNVWKAYIVRSLRDLSQHMDRNPNVAMGVVLATNLVFFAIINRIDNRLENLFEKPNEQETKTRKFFKHVVINGLTTGGATAGVNILLSKSTGYFIDARVVLMLAATASIARIIISLLFKKMATAEQLPQLKTELPKNNPLLIPKKESLSVKSPMTHQNDPKKTSDLTSLPTGIMTEPKLLSDAAVSSEKQDANKASLHKDHALTVELNGKAIPNPPANEKNGVGVDPLLPPKILSSDEQPLAPSPPGKDNIISLATKAPVPETPSENLPNETDQPLSLLSINSPPNNTVLVQVGKNAPTTGLPDLTTQFPVASLVDPTLISPQKTDNHTNAIKPVNPPDLIDHIKIDHDTGVLPPPEPKTPETETLPPKQQDKEETQSHTDKGVLTPHEPKAPETETLPAQQQDKEEPQIDTDKEVVPPTEPNIKKTEIVPAHPDDQEELQNDSDNDPEYEKSENGWLKKMWSSVSGTVRNILNMQREIE